MVVVVGWCGCLVVCCRGKPKAKSREPEPESQGGGNNCNCVPTAGNSARRSDKWARLGNRRLCFQPRGNYYRSMRDRPLHTESLRTTIDRGRQKRRKEKRTQIKNYKLQSTGKCKTKTEWGRKKKKEKEEAISFVPSFSFTSVSKKERMEKEWETTQGKNDGYRKRPKKN